MSLASDLLEKMKKKGQLKIKPEPLPEENPGEPSEDQGADHGQPEQPEPGGVGPLFSGSIEGEKPESQKAPAEGKVKGARMAPVKIFSKLFDEEIWLVADQEEMEALVRKGVKETIYMAWEIPILRGKSKEHLKAIHQTKKVFPGCALA